MRKARFPFPSKAPVKALTLLLLAAVSFAADKSAKIPEGPDWIPLDDPKLQEVLAKSEAAGAYDVPALNLKKDENYANTSVDVEPFGGTKPWKENFLSQLTYWGAGRAKPEPENLETRQDRLHRPDHADRLGGDRRQEPRGGARGSHAAGIASRRRGVERPRRVHEAEDPVRAGGLERQRPLGLLRATRSSSRRTPTTCGGSSGRSTGRTATSRSAWPSRPRS